MKKTLSAIAVTLFAFTLAPLFAQGRENTDAATSVLRTERIQAADSNNPGTLLNGGSVAKSEKPDPTGKDVGGKPSATSKDAVNPRPSPAATKTITIEPEKCVTRCYYILGVPIICYEICY